MIFNLLRLFGVVFGAPSTLLFRSLRLVVDMLITSGKPAAFLSPWTPETILIISLWCFSVSSHADFARL